MDNGVRQGILDWLIGKDTAEKSIVKIAFRFSYASNQRLFLIVILL
jgi:hypothetical protein